MIYNIGCVFKWLLRFDKQTIGFNFLLPTHVGPMSVCVCLRQIDTPSVFNVNEEFHFLQWWHLILQQMIIFDDYYYYYQCY